MIPHDDIVHGEYLETLLHCLSHNKNASIAFADIESFGDGTHAILKQDSLRGTKYDRVLTFLRCHYNAVAFRGLVRRGVAGDRLFLTHNRHKDLSLDTLWVLQMAMQGEIVRVPQVLYKKRYLARSAHWGWQQWDPTEKEQAWATHCQDCIQLLREDAFSEEECLGLTQMCQRRLSQEREAFCPHKSFRHTLDKRALLSRLFNNILPKR